MLAPSHVHGHPGRAGSGPALSAVPSAHDDAPPRIGAASVASQRLPRRVLGGVFRGSSPCRAAERQKHDRGYPTAAYQTDEEPPDSVSKARRAPRQRWAGSDSSGVRSSCPSYSRPSLAHCPTPSPSSDRPHSPSVPGLEGPGTGAGWSMRDNRGARAKMPAESSRWQNRSEPAPTRPAPSPRDHLLNAQGGLPRRLQHS